jgi:hypothetical protein
MNKWFQKNLINLIFGFIGLAFALIGAGFVWGGIHTHRENRSVEELPLYAPAEFAAAPAGTQVSLEGRLSERNTGYIDGLVAYTARQFQGIECEEDSEGEETCHEVWRLIEQETPALWLDVAGEQVRIGNSDYQLRNEPEIWQTTATPIVQKTVEYRGFRRGNPVFTIGTLTKNDGVVISADFIYGGNREAYLDNQTNEANTLLVLGAVFGGFGLVFLMVAIVLARIMR